MKKKSKKTFLLRIDNELFNAISELAEKECRSVNSEIEFILRQAIASRKNSQRIRMETTSDENKISLEGQKQELKQTDNQNVAHTTSWMGIENIPD